MAEDVALAERGRKYGIDAEEKGDVLIGVEAVGYKERKHDDVFLSRVLVPVGDERRRLHVGVEHLGVEAGVSDAVGFASGGGGGLIVKIGAVRDNEEGGLCRGDIRGGGGCAFEENLGDGGVAADGITVLQKLVWKVGDWPGEVEFTGDDGASEIAFADEVRHDVDILAVRHVEDLSETWFFFPESAVDFFENGALADCFGVGESGGAGVRVQGGSVSDDKESAVRLFKHGRRGWEERQTEGAIKRPRKRGDGRENAERTGCKQSERSAWKSEV